MGIEALSELGKVAGIAGIAIGALVLIFSSVIQKKIFPGLTKEQGYKVIRMIVGFAGILALVGIGAWVYLDVVKNSREKENRMVSKYVVGQVLNEAGEPVVSANIEVSQDDSFLDKTDGTGRFTLLVKGMGEKYYDVVVRHKSYKVARQKVKINFEDDESNEVLLPKAIVMINAYPPDQERKEDDNEDQYTGRTQKSEHEGKTTSGSTGPTASSITLNYMGDMYGCSLSLYFDIGGMEVVPNSNSFRVSGIPSGIQNYNVSGLIDCGYSGQCNATGSGSIAVQNNADYYVMWNQYTCKVQLYTQQDYNRINGF